MSEVLASLHMDAMQVRSLTISMKVLLQGPTLDSPVAICGESTRKNADVAERALCRFVQNLPTVRSFST